MSIASPHDMSARIQVPFADLEFTFMGRHMALSRLPFIATASAPHGQNDAQLWCLLKNDAYFRAESVSRLLQQANILRLRVLLARDEPFVHRLDDQHVRGAICRLVQRGTVGLFERIDTRFIEVQPTASPPRGPSRETFLDTLTPIAIPKAPERSRAPTAQVRAEQLPISARVLDQNAQAATLVVAAQVGAPFCEECARHAAERAQGFAA